MNQKRWLAAVTLGLLLVTAAVPAGAQDVVELEPEEAAPIYATDEFLDETPRGWFVELDGDPVSEGGSKASLKKMRDDFRGKVKTERIDVAERFEYESLFHGFSIWTDSSQLPAISRIAGVKAIYPVIEIARPEPEPNEEPELVSALAMTGADIAQAELGYTGRGIKVAVMDTGIDYDHPDLGGCFGPDCRVAYGYDFVGDDFNADPDHPGFNPHPTPDPDPDDCGAAGHGTHVAGIVGANGRIKGVAPDVTLGAYRVFGCEGSTTADIMVAAMERAYKDGMQVLNMSIGAPFQWPQYPSAVAADRLVKKGMVVVASIGNSGANGLYAAGAPGVGERVIGVASFDNSHATLPVFTVSPDETEIGYTRASPSPLPPSEGALSIARTGSPTATADGCAPLPADSLSGQAALVRRGGCTFYEKAFHAQSAGAAAVLLYNNAPGRINPSVAGDPAITIPVVAISDTEGLLIDSRLDEGEVTLTWTDQLGTFPSPTGGRIASTSSYGLAADLSLKPDIGAPGGGIYSTYPLEAGGYATLGGTSMAAPHVAGAVALLLEARPGTRPEAVRALLQNTAEPRAWWGNPALGFLDNVHRQGAGMLQIDRAILAKVSVEPSKLSLGETGDRPVAETLSVRNDSGRRITYRLSHEPALSTGPKTYTPSFMTGFAEVAFDEERVTLSPRGVTKVRLRIAANPDLPDGSIYGGYILLTPENGDGPILRIPYAGFKGDYQGITALAPTQYGLPWLARSQDGSYSKEEEGAAFTLTDGDLPYVLLHLDHQVRRLRIEVKDLDGNSHGFMLDREYVGRNSTPTGFFAYAFDGSAVAKKKEITVPDGAYVLEVSALKALGSEKNPDDWESWTSPSFTITRP